MKKFSSRNINENKIIKKEHSLESIILNILNENLEIKVVDQDKYVDKNINIIGKEETINKITEFFKLCENNNNFILQENSKIKNSVYLDLNEKNKRLDYLNSLLEEMNSIPTPLDVFDAEDYDYVDIDDGDYIVIKLKSLTQIPEDYFYYLTETSIENYFNEGHHVKIKQFKDGKWMLYFEGDLSEYGTSADDVREKYFMFLESHSDFIKSFIDATKNTIGEDNVVYFKNK